MAIIPIELRKTIYPSVHKCALMDNVADINLDHMVRFQSLLVKASTDSLGVKTTSVLINNSSVCCQKVLLV